MKTLHLLIISIVTLPCGERHALAEPEYVDCSTTIQRLTKAHQAVAPAIREYEVAKKERDASTTKYEYLKRDYAGNFEPQRLAAEQATQYYNEAKETITRALKEFDAAVGPFTEECVLEVNKPRVRIFVPSEETRGAIETEFEYLLIQGNT
jgi:hypothetical protein